MSLGGLGSLLDFAIAKVRVRDRISWLAGIYVSEVDFLSLEERCA